MPEPQPHTAVKPPNTFEDVKPSNNSTAKAFEPAIEQRETTFKRGFAFWSVIAALSVTAIMSSLENSVIVTAGPIIVADLGMGNEYVWIANAFFVSCAAFQPLFGQCSNIFGRRWVMISATAIFTLGSGVCGGATNGSMLIAGRAIQGIGSGGVGMLGHIIISDLVPLRQRGYYLAIVLSLFAVGLTLGPFIGGSFADIATWRWAFYINLPLGGVSLLMFYFFLHVQYDKETKMTMKLKRIDWTGNGLMVASTVATLYALSGTGFRYSWASWHTIVPLILGLFGYFLFAGWEARFGMGLMPPRLFQHRTSMTVAIGTFLHWMLVYWVLYFLPIYFESVLLYSPMRTGVVILPITLVSFIGSAASAISMSHWGRFKYLHVIGEGIFTVGVGLFSLQNESTTKAEWAVFQCISAVGCGMLLDTLLPAFQAPVSESDQATASATWAFIRSVGGVWGVAIAATVLNNRVSKLAYKISDPGARHLLTNHGGYQYASASFVKSYPEPIRGEIRAAVYREALKLVFLVGVAFGSVSTLIFLLEKDIKLRTELETKYGLDRKEEKYVGDKEETGAN